jgi:hypothetical protein
MHPQSELTRLSARKCALRARIRSQRASCAAAVVRLTQPLRWLDELMALWRGLAPLVWVSAVPLGLLVRQAAAPRSKGLRTLLRWGPAALSVVSRLAGKT